MSGHFRYIVVGRGMMGAAATRHLALATDGVAAIGPDEPADRKNHDGVFASHYDEGRITRTIDPDRDWALLANRSIARYREIERDSGVSFYTPAGCLVVGPTRSSGNGYVARTESAARSLGVETSLLDDAGLKERFGYFRFPEGSEGVHEATGAGYISPRNLVRAQSVSAAKAGAEMIDDIAVSIREEGGLVSVETASGRSYRAEKVLLAAGGFSIAENLLPQPVDLKVYARTIAFFEVSEAAAEAFAGMPSLIAQGADGADGIYMLPPIRYPDGRLYMKIGGDPDDVTLQREPELRSWFRQDGRESVQAHLAKVISGLVPELKPVSTSTGSCVVSFTPSGYPMIGYGASTKIGVLTGGCGTAAKSSDEIGRLGAELLLEGKIKEQGYTTDFKPYFR
ncbi:FAD-dependent oxidoreductase [Rhizobium sp. S152]|uniref:FAD-dependent oxidoreductase n=1 Tax=Rhizobium sp. S152 TaxID=3055038 RepID=UPI0025AA0B47|nr:FAD-dependent oxidoreductase [Rhizobium sp. S152]MDM9628647.1 FAD-dependent oxidoreductase [Rhizobium sp. S152]